MHWNTPINAENNRSFQYPNDISINRHVFCSQASTCLSHMRDFIYFVTWDSSDRVSFFLASMFILSRQSEVCVHTKHVSKSVNSAGLLHEGMFSNNFAQLSLNFRDEVSIYSCRYIPGSRKFTQLPLLQAQSSVWNRLSFLNNFLMFLHKLNKIFRANWMWISDCLASSILKTLPVSQESYAYASSENLPTTIRNLKCYKLAFLC